MESLIIAPGTRAMFDGKEVIILKRVDGNLICVQETNRNLVHTVPVSKLTSIFKNSDSVPIEFLTEKEWKIAKKRYSIIEPLLNDQISGENLSKIAHEHSVSRKTIYRWKSIYSKYNTISSLANKRKLSPKRLDKSVESIIQFCIKKYYLSQERKPLRRTLFEIHNRCLELPKHIKLPSESTIRRRRKETSEQEIITARYGKKHAEKIFKKQLGMGFKAEFPLQTVQIDHTKLDIILVDEIKRHPIGRPNLTIAIDIFSRMIIGYYLSFDPPGAISVGMCIVNSILPKEKLLEEYKISGSWPCCGIPKSFHTDNAREFRGKMLSKATKNFNINLFFRRVATPQMGGHIERLIGTLANEIHGLCGTTFSNPQEKANYDSKKHASMSIVDFEKWLVTYIVNVYHKRPHSSLKDKPINVYKEATDKFTGTFRIITDEEVKYNFMPFKKVTIQDYGIRFNNLYYTDEILAEYRHKKNKHGKPKKYTIRYDPRDITRVYFPDPIQKCFVEIPIRDIEIPPMSIWTYREIIKNLKSNSEETKYENIIARRKMIEIEEAANNKTKKEHTLRSSLRNDHTVRQIKNIDNSNLKDIDWLNVKPYKSKL